ncbi:MAG: YciI family protein [Acidimicrobiales bacterium]
MAEFMLLYVNRPGSPPAPLSDADLQAVIARYIAWSERVAAQGHASPRGGARLIDVYADPGRVVSNTNGEFLAAYGPLAETKEVVGGYTVIEATNYDEVVELCRDHPAAEHGSIVIRQLA